MPNCTSVHSFKKLLRDSGNVQIVECSELEANARGLWALELEPGRCVVGMNYNLVRSETERLRGLK